MKTIGLIGGMSWQSTQEYYRLINREVQSRLGGHHSARCVLFSVDFAEIENCQREGAWDRAAAVLIRAAQSLEKAGADFLILCTNTMHRVAGEIEKSVAIPLLHIAEVTAGEIAAAGISTVGLLGTRYTMEQEFFKSRIAA
ncbi:MAG TPA: amino acid racemase, partial [Bacillota bacterium]|nr:amino acid racemase [Bacillota bacterium]